VDFLPPFFPSTGLGLGFQVVKDPAGLQGGNPAGFFLATAPVPDVFLGFILGQHEAAFQQPHAGGLANDN
jgi:hypothetical protein